MWIELHNVPIFFMQALCALPLALAGDLSWRFGVLYAIISFVMLGGRILTHGWDLSRSNPRWLRYVVVNLLLNLIACTMLVLMFRLI